MTTQEKAAFLEDMERKRGYIIEMHKIMVEADFDWVKAYERFLEATYTDQRLLDRKTKELLQFVTEAALRADVDQIEMHVKNALEHGATPRECLEALEAVVTVMGMLCFRRGLEAWARAVGAMPKE